MLIIARNLTKCFVPFILMLNIVEKKETEHIWGGGTQARQSREKYKQWGQSKTKAVSKGKGEARGEEDDDK